MTVIRRVRGNLSAAYAAALGPEGVEVTSPQIALVGAYVLIYGLSMLTVIGDRIGAALPVVAAVLLGFVGIGTGIALAWRPTGPVIEGLVAGWGRTVAVACVMVAVGTVAMVLYLLAIGDIPILMSAAEEGRVEAAVRGGAPLRVLGLLALPGCWLLVAQATRARHRALAAWTLVALALTLAAQVATANRAPAFQLVAVSIAIVLLMSNRQRFGARGIAGVGGIAVALVLALGVIGAVRLASSLPPGASRPYAFLTGQAILGYLRVPVQNLGFTLEAVPDHIGWRLGYTYLQPMLTVLPGHQTTFDQDLKAALQQTYPGGGTVPGMLGEAYANFGPLGWFLIPLGLGAWLTWLSRTVAAARTPEFRAMYAFALVHAVGAMVGGLLVASPFPVIAYVVLGAAAIASIRGVPLPSDPLVQRSEASPLG